MDMRISSVYNAYKTYPAKNQAAPASKVRGEKKAGDTVSLSATGNEYGIAYRAVHELPDVREAHVNRIAAQMQAGTYQVSGADIAAKIFAG